MAPTIGVNLRVTGHCNQGSRKYMEDMFSVAYQQTEDELDLEYAYFGIFDGHGGHEAATFAKEHLMKAIVSQSGFWSDNDKDVLRAIKEGFIATHYAMWRNLENWPKTQSGWPSTSGTTASIAFIRRSNIYIGHVGDSCIVLGYQDPCSDRWKGAPLTMDHKPEDPVEHKRIRQAGGMVLQKSGVPRVVWHRPRVSHKGPLTRSTHFDLIPFLAVARSLGDLWSYNPDSDRFVVSPEPDVSVHHIDLTRDRCLIFGTDGLWNMLSPQEAVNIVEKAECNNKSSNIEGQDQVWQNPSKCLVDSALNNWTKRDLRADNTSAVTLLLDPLGPPQSQVLDHQNSASQSQSEFVPYHIESYKINEGKSPNKLPYQSSGLAICTWYPNNSGSEPGNKTDGLTSLSTMEKLFGEKVKIIKSGRKETGSSENTKDPRETAKTNSVAPSTSKTSLAELQVHLKKIPLSYSTVLRNANRSEDEAGTRSRDSKVNSAGAESGEKKKSEPLVVSKQGNRQSQSEENITRMKLRGGSLGNRVPERSASDDAMTRNCHKSGFHVKPMKRNGKRGKKRKSYELIKSELNGLNSKRLRSKNKRRHSSLIETMNMMYEPRPKRRTRSEDHRKSYENEEYKSDTENELDEEINKVRKMAAKSAVAQVEVPESSEETRQNHLQERLHYNSNNNSHSNSSSNSSSSSNSVGNNSNNSGSISNSNNSNNNSEEYTPMRLRSYMPVKTLRSRNINLKNCDMLVIGLSKININPIRKSASRQTCKSEEAAEVAVSNRNSAKVTGLLCRNSVNNSNNSNSNSNKLPVNELSQRSSTVHTRSQNKRLRK